MKYVFVFFLFGYLQCHMEAIHNLCSTLSDFDSDCPIHLNFICSNTIIIVPTICGQSRISGFNPAVT